LVHFWIVRRRRRRRRHPVKVQVQAVPKVRRVPIKKAVRRIYQVHHAHDKI